MSIIGYKHKKYIEMCVNCTIVGYSTSTPVSDDIMKETMTTPNMMPIMTVNVLVLVVLVGLGLGLGAFAEAALVLIFSRASRSLAMFPSANALLLAYVVMREFSASSNKLRDSM
jgi:hypothetical protein